MDPPRGPPSHTLELFADPSCVKEVVKAVLHTIFFHRYFIPITPATRDLLDVTLPTVLDVELDTLIDASAASLVRAIDGSDQPAAATNGHQSGRAKVAVSFYEKRRRKAYFFGKADEEVCWEVWTLDVTCATPRTESGRSVPDPSDCCSPRTDAAKVRRAMEKSLQKTAVKIITIVNRDKDHIPPITSTDTNPFPFQIKVNKT
jgi:autophagy-related protein 101